MYDPAIVRVVDILITKLILLLVAEVSSDTSLIMNENIQYGLFRNGSLK